MPEFHPVFQGYAHMPAGSIPCGWIRSVKN